MITEKPKIRFVLIFLLLNIYLFFSFFNYFFLNHDAMLTDILLSS